MGSRRLLRALSFTGAACAVLAAGTAGAAETPLLRCPLNFYLEDPRVPPALLGALAFEVVYAPADVRFAGSGTGVECVRLLADGTARFDDDDAGRLSIELSSNSGMSSLFQLLARCTTVSTTAPVAMDFAIETVVETELGGKAVSPPVAVRLLLPLADDCKTAESTTTTTTTETSTTTTTLPLSERCGDPSADGSVTATDALYTLSAAVGILPCAPCVCDADGSGGVAASDALLLLGISVGQSAELRCEDCPPASASD